MQCVVSDGSIRTCASDRRCCKDRFGCMSESKCLKVVKCGAVYSSVEDVVTQESGSWHHYVQKLVICTANHSVHVFVVRF